MVAGYCAADLPTVPTIGQMLRLKRDFLPATMPGRSDPSDQDHGIGACDGG